MDVAQKLQLLQVALTLGPVEEVHANIRKVLDILDTQALWPTEPRGTASSQAFRR